VGQRRYCTSTNILVFWQLTLVISTNNIQNAELHLSRPRPFSKKKIRGLNKEAYGSSGRKNVPSFPGTGNTVLSCSSIKTKPKKSQMDALNAPRHSVRTTVHVLLLSVQTPCFLNPSKPCSMTRVKAEL
jgi:hypothetical protein